MAFAMFRPLPPPEHTLQPKPQILPPAYYQNVFTLPKPPPPPQFYAQHEPPRQIVSPIEAPTPANVSPNSQQILLYKKGPVAKTLYTPAVLRPTESPRPRQTMNFTRTNSSPLTPPGSLQNSLDSLDKNMLKRTNTGDSGQTGVVGVSLFEEEILRRDPEEPGYGRVTGLPTRMHWKVDSAATTCDDPSCERRFTYFNRKHHCRRCGLIFCDTHSSNLIPLNQDAEFHPQGNRVRGCDSCWRDYSGWEVKRVEFQSQRERIKNGEIIEASTSLPSPVSVTGMGDDSFTKKRQGWITPPGTPGFQQRGAAQIASSVPGDWCWSSF